MQGEAVKQNSKELLFQTLPKTSSSATKTDRLYKLLNLAISEKAQFVIIECTTKDKKDNEYEDGRIPKLRVDIKSFDVKKLVSDLLVLLSDKERDDTLKVIESRDKNKKKVRQPIIDNLHALALSEKASKDELACKGCSKLLSGPSCQCVDCDDFNLHKLCAESAPNLDKCPPFLRTVKPDQYYKCALLATNAMTATMMFMSIAFYQASLRRKREHYFILN
ncbi:hypothetical protein GH714_021489 [Hevea brasiliensis]|uniref:DC1 domain-containing protein n=1 Tax=Hevea brasiliensis TaxID=3981 RepID=A0A6A6MJU3_HEVBR|nr:hypothetical protein GH714_021489 [Hevea brasiliensis]